MTKPQKIVMGWDLNPAATFLPFGFWEWKIEMLNLDCVEVTQLVPPFMYANREKILQALRQDFVTLLSIVEAVIGYDEDWVHR